MNNIIIDIKRYDYLLRKLKNLEIRVYVKT